MRAKQNPVTDTTLDKLLGGRFEVEQPAKGYRIAVDTLLLAAAVPAMSGQTVCELGCGVGGVMLALATRVPDCFITGVELQPAMAALCASNIGRNAFADRLKVVQGDMATLPLSFEATYDHVMMNPPFHDPKTHTVSANEAKRLAHAESDTIDLAVWVAQASRCLKPDGQLTLIHRADRLDEIVALAQRHFHCILVKPVIAREGAAPKRVIVRASTSSPAGVMTLPPFVLYGEDNRYNEGAEQVLRNAEPILF